MEVPGNGTVEFHLTKKGRRRNTVSLIVATSIVLVTVGKGTATTGEPVVQFVTPATGSAVILIRNVAASAALNGTITINFAVFNA